jgi:hypothetical protein
MSIINNIFTTTQKGDNLFECINITYNTSQLKLTNTSNSQVYVYKDLQLHVDKNNNKQYIKVINDSHHQQNNVIIQKIYTTIIQPVQFPLINKYDNVISRQIKTFHDNKTNIYINVIYDTFTNTNNKKELVTYLQLNGEYTFENIVKLLSSILNL